MNLSRSLFILELGHVELKAIAKGLHVLLLDGDNEGAEKALEALCQQTTLVKKDAEKHGVYDSQIAPKHGTKEIKGVYYTP